MNKFVLELDDRFQKPLVKMRNWHDLTALLDTGALFPVWTSDEIVLQELGAKLIKTRVAFSGFGGKTHGDLYRLSELRLGTLVFPNFPVITSQEMSNEPYHLILSATMFQRLRYTIDDKAHTLIVEIPDDETMTRHLRIYDSKGKLHVLCGNA